MLRRFRWVQILLQTVTRRGIAVELEFHHRWQVVVYYCCCFLLHSARSWGPISQCDERTQRNRGQLIRKKVVVKDLRLILSENRKKMPHKK